MSNIATLSEFARLVDKRMDKILTDDYPQLAAKIPQLFGTASVDKTFYEMTGVNGIGDVVPFSGKLQFANVTPGFYTRIEPSEYALGLMIEKKLKDDILYGGTALTERQAALAKASARTREKHAVKAFAEGTSVAWEYMTNEEGVAWFSTAHTTKSGASTTSGFSNLGTSAFSRATLAATWIAFKRFRDPMGELYESEPDTIICPVSLEDYVREALGSSLDPDSANNRMNIQNGKRWNVIAWARLDEYSTKSWGICNMADLKKKLMWISRTAPEYNTWDDPHTFATMQSLYERYGWGWSDWRPIYWHNVS